MAAPTMIAVAMRPTNEDRIRAALWFAERGFRVFSVWSATDAGICRCPAGARCESPGKHPTTARGFDDATDDATRIRTFLSAASQPNYGLVNPEGVFALDVDGPGVATLAELEAKHGPLPPTLRTQTAHGEHVFLRWPATLPRPIGQMFGYVTRWGSGRGAGYVIGPRSVHPSGAVYVPAPGSPFEIAQLPDAWAHAVLGPAGPVLTITGGAYQVPEHVPPTQSRYGEILKYTANLYNRGFSTDEMWAAVRDILAPRFDAPLSEPELRSRFDRTVADLPKRLGPRRSAPPEPVDPSAFQEPEDRGLATLSDLGEVEYIEDLVRPGRIVVWAAEEGSGKSYAVSGELAIRLAASGGSFAGTWPVLTTGRVLVLSEMHADDDYEREENVLGALGLDRTALHGRYYRLSLMTAAGGAPVLTVPEWRGWAIQWMDQRDVVLLVVDTATGATQVDPWGKEIQGVFSALRVMLENLPTLAIILVVHLRKPNKGSGERGLSDVLGEWGRWCDVVVLQENDGNSLERAKLTVRKRVRQQRRIVVTKRHGLLVEPADLQGPTAKVSLDVLLEFIASTPGATYADMVAHFGVDGSTVRRYIKRLGKRVMGVADQDKRLTFFIAGGEPAHESVPGTSEHEMGALSGRGATQPDEGGSVTANPLISLPDEQGPGVASPPTPKGVRVGVVGDATEIPDPALRIVPAAVVDWLRPCRDYAAHQSHHRQTDAGWLCEICEEER